eukprot:CAMPEP_0198224190 /NCGR_PEP_ID=MMETSP1445-20131203/95727_1 /TAXON_ID=36898 /ORGANISM="Pyramimonas sp., Strain CCMP2087" /LENGTH=47 /DNA_ID= /DNA_START= /DNA_END= /DNA_ORIENTATION=
MTSWGAPPLPKFKIPNPTPAGSEEWKRELRNKKVSFQGISGTISGIL